MASEFVARIDRLFAANGIADYRYENRAKHRAVVLIHRGRRRTFFFPLSGSDRRGPQKMVSFLRRELGLTAR